MQKHLAAAIFCLLASFGAMATPGEIAEGRVLPELSMRGLTGAARPLSAFLGKPLIINMWASYCSPCLQEMGSLERLAGRFGARLNVIGISIDDYPERALAFLAKVRTSFPHFIDHQLEIEHLLGANRIPLTVLVDAEGRILHKIYGAREWDSPEVVEAIGQAFGF